MTEAEVPYTNQNQDKKLQHFSNGMLILAILLFLFGAGYRLGEYNAREDAKKVAAAQPVEATVSVDAQKYQSETDMSLFWQVWGLVKQKYADQGKVKTKEMLYGAIKGMVASLGDPYSYFLTPKENQQSKDDLGGKYEGIGAELGMRDNRIIVVTPLENSPAKKAGIKPGDIILAVDGKTTRGWTINQAVNNIRGEKGTIVKLTLYRNDKQLEVKIKRNSIKVESVKLSYLKKAAIIKVSHFGDTTAQEWDKAVLAVKAKWAAKEIKGLIVDMRSNPGGYLDGAVYLSSDFLPQGALVVKQEYADRPAHEYLVTRQGELLNIPLVVLINEGSASAAEIFSGALRDHDRATLVGKKSFGKGSVQEALDLSESTGLHLTIAKWVLPDGDWINSKGIMPEVEVEIKLKDGNTLTDETDNQLQRALSILVD